jgi:hypothetical protein
MSLILLEGFDYATGNAELAKRGYITACSTGNGRFTGRSVYFGNSGSYLIIPLWGDYQSLWFGFALKTGSTFAYSSGYPFLRLRHGNSDNLNFHVTTTGELVVRSSVEVGRSDPGVINLSSWHYLDVYAKIHNSAGELIVKVNGNEVINETGKDTQESSSDIVDNFELKYVYSGSANFDDFYADDSKNHGDIKVVTKLPNANGTYSDFTPLAGSNYENVDETYPDDDSTYNEGKAVGDKDSFEIPTTELDGSIIGVQLSNYVRKTGTKKTGIKSLVRVGGSNYLGNEKFLSNDYLYKASIFEVNPDTSNPWSAAQIGAAEFGIEVTSLSTTTTT